MYETKECGSQKEVLQDLNTYLTSNGQVVAISAITEALKEKDKILQVNKAVPPKRCCGR